MAWFPCNNSNLGGFDNLIPKMKDLSNFTASEVSLYIADGKGSLWNKQQSFDGTNTMSWFSNSHSHLISASTTGIFLILTAPYSTKLFIKTSSNQSFPTSPTLNWIPGQTVVTIRLNAPDLLAKAMEMTEGLYDIEYDYINQFSSMGAANGTTGDGYYDVWNCYGRIKSDTTIYLTHSRCVGTTTPGNYLAVSYNGTTCTLQTINKTDTSVTELSAVNYLNNSAFFMYKLV